MLNKTLPVREIYDYFLQFYMNVTDQQIKCNLVSVVVKCIKTSLLLFDGKRNDAIKTRGNTHTALKYGVSRLHAVVLEK